VGRGAGLGRFGEEKNYHALAAGKATIIDDAWHIVFWLSKIVEARTSKIHFNRNL
jgi:hypothetical protein